MIALLAAAAALAAPAQVAEGLHTPFYPPSPEQAEVRIPAFRLDATPVTNAQFLAFAYANPRWQRGQVPALFADSSYLAHWAGPTALGSAGPDQPVTHVSWFAARAYCQAQGGSLPTTDQWEYAADATAAAPRGGRADPATQSLILAWYSRSDALPAVGQGTANYWGVSDLLGVVWEWTEDFNSLLLAADARESGDEDLMRFCGAGALSAIDPGDYATFMRYAFRGSLKAHYTTMNLGFRCAYPL